VHRVAPGVSAQPIPTVGRPNGGAGWRDAASTGGGGSAELGVEGCRGCSGSRRRLWEPGGGANRRFVEDITSVMSCQRAGLKGQLTPEEEEAIGDQM
jgi:hypothetical protein